MQVKKENSEFKIINFTSYKKFYFHCLANAELKSHTKILKNLLLNMALTNLCDHYVKACDHYVTISSLETWKH